ncbi:Hypothetical protein CAP_2725 [Chondromyces apiculatus DSM 436]|uniref:Uncharacterized protein n=1 Tax=Chondromyces apiculatus DSM 436 TaxID=1192034 RepID=A0A017THY4_9BACT|nr:Hypothetical protein CAP_2725 [Chondromyces apiculatus DSM 436]
MLFRAALLLATACGAPPPPTEPTPTPSSASRPSPPPPPTELNGPLGEHHSARFDLVLPLPDGAGWRVDDATTLWLVATHAASATTLLLRTWRPDDRGTRPACEAQARLWRDLPGGDGRGIIDQHRVDVPTGFDTEVAIGVTSTPEHPALVEGFAVAFGGWSRRCFAYIATTRAQGDTGPALVATRLAAMVELSLAGIRLESELAPSVSGPPRFSPRP